jgi:hypothetical protein
MSRHTRELLLSGLIVVAMLHTHPARAADPVILFVTQPPFGADFATVNSTFGNQNGETEAAPRGGDLYIRYADGVLRNLTAEAGYGTTSEPDIAVREPSVHWSGTKALFAMVIGGTTLNDYSPVFWQIYEVTGFGGGETVQITRLPQPLNSNNVAPIYGTDDRIIFASDRPRSGDPLTYPQLDEYESTATVTGLWSMNPDGSDLQLLDHSVSGDFTPIIAADGRLIFTRWDHLQRDQQNAEGMLGYGAFNYASETSTQALNSSAEIFPELRTQPAGSFQHGHEFNFFFPWQLNEDGTGIETLNHVGRHELAGYFDSANDNLPEFIAPTGRRTAELLLQLKEDPNRPGYFYGTHAPEFGTHAAGQLIGLNGGESVNADDMQVDYITDPLTNRILPDNVTQPSSNPGHFRNPVPLSDGSLIAVQTASAYQDRTVSGQLSSRYDFHLVRLSAGSPFRTPGAPLIPAGITKTISYWDNQRYEQAIYSGRLWELDPVEVRPRTRPARHLSPLPEIETQILSDELGGQAGIDRLRAFLHDNNLALMVSRNVTRRADRQQEFNLKIAGSSTQTAEAGATPTEIAYLQLFQGDLVRGYDQFNGGRRPIAQLLHDGLNPDLPGAPPSTVKLADDGSYAALVPARRALTWQLVTDTGDPVVRERFWVTFPPGEIRACTNCHGINRTDTVLHQPPPTNPPAALRDLARWWRTNFDNGGTPLPTRTETPSPTQTLTPPPTSTPSSTAPPTVTATRRPSPTRTPSVTRRPTITVTPTITRRPSLTPTRALTRRPTRTPTATPTATLTRSPVPTRTRTRTRRPTVTPTPTNTRRPTITPTRTMTRRPTLTRTPTVTRPPTRTPTGVV